METAATSTARTQASTAQVPPLDRAAAGRIVGADAVRAAACLWVFFAHWDMALPVGGSPRSFHKQLLAAGDLGVGMFFVLSGFLLSQPFWSAHRKGPKLPNLKVYAARRLARIVPGYYLCITITALVAGAYHSRWDKFALGLTYTFTNSFLPGTYLPSFDRPLWSIGVEMLFYVMLPLAMWGTFHFRRAWLARAFIVTLITAIVVGQWGFLQAAPRIERWVGNKTFFNADPTCWATWRNAVAMFAHFLIGTLAADLLLNLRTAPWMPKLQRIYLWDVLAVAAIAAIIVSSGVAALALPQVKYMDFGWPTFHLLIGGLLATLPYSRIVGPVLDNGLMRWTATLSFGIYMWHVPVLGWTGRALEHAELSPGLKSAVFCVLALMAVYAVASASYYVLERPILNWAHRTTARK